MSHEMQLNKHSDIESSQYTKYWFASNNLVLIGAFYQTPDEQEMGMF